MTAPGAAKSRGNVSQVTGLALLGAQAEDSGGEDLADLGEPLGRGHQVEVEGARQRRNLREAGAARRISAPD
jgi:hypothetical protein